MVEPEEQPWKALVHSYLQSDTLMVQAVHELALLLWEVCQGYPEHSEAIHRFALEELTRVVNQEWDALKIKGT
jgi:hypothetical protein